MRLASEQLVVLEDHKGFRVAPVSPDEALDIAHSRWNSKVSRSSTSMIVAPSAERITSGVPPTLPNARTGEFTPPGVTFFARANHASLCGLCPLPTAAFFDPNLTTRPP